MALAEGLLTSGKPIGPQCEVGMPGDCCGLYAVHCFGIGQGLRMSTANRTELPDSSSGGSSAPGWYKPITVADASRHAPSVPGRLSRAPARALCQKARCLAVGKGGQLPLVLRFAGSALGVQGLGILNTGSANAFHQVEPDVPFDSH